MTKVLIGSKNVQTDLNDFPFLKNNNDFEIITSNTGKETLCKCRNLQPNIIILDSNISDMKYSDVMERISMLPYENNKCNLILSVEKPEDKLLLKHTSVLYEVLEQPIDKKEAKKTLIDLKTKYEIPNISTKQVKDILLQLGINTYTLGSQCLVSAIFKCYYYPEDFYTLDNIYRKVALEFDITKEDVKNKIRHTIDTINTSTNIDGQKLYFSIFGNLAKLSSRTFLQLFIKYLNNLKSKN